ncbi:globin-coupled sensor protein [Bacillus sp. FJAT-49736]|uniref:globin-coupled sensor protein n=1 Tax=Bacillus sp. FJAT-49736 TaxID=2833582 RepID=UPI001BCA1029|nr:globin-coupled sensor protein [Bacillus sp. FJAT-49736]MBS4174314.1 globin-coupled sensor protein [Bacillus sp. FJAT-49736]
MVFKISRTRKNEMKVNMFGTPEIRVDKNSEVYKQIKMIELTLTDLQQIMRLKPFIDENINYIVDRFYSNLENEPSLLSIIDHNSSIERLKITLKRHITEMFTGIINDEYLQKRIRIAHVHVKIGLQTKWYMCAFQDLFLSILHIVQDKLGNSEESFSSIRAVSKLLNLEQQLVLEAYDAQLEKLKTETEQQKNLIRNKVTHAAQQLASITDETNASFHQLNSESKGIISHATKGAELSQLAEKRAMQGKEQLQKQNINMTNIQGSVSDISEDVHVLLETTKQMQEIISLVTNIADQTNLLSLNAAIEAARAGENGLGFSVVAGEVRKLSDVTKESVTNVSTLISSMNAQTEKLTMSLETIKNEVHDGNRNMEETKEHFLEIHGNVVETKAQNNKMKEELISFSQIIQELGKAFDDVALSADHLNTLAEEMNK